MIRLKKKNINGHKKSSPTKRLYVCPRCLDYHYSTKRNCLKCGCSKGYTSVLRRTPETRDEIPKEDWERIISYRKLNGYNYLECEKYYAKAPLLGVRIPRDDKPSYIMKAVGKPKSQRGGFGGIANHAGVSGYTHTVNGGSCSPK